MLADIRGVQINYEVSGNASGPWLTFSNSLATNLGMWREQEAALAGDYRILRYDKRGHGNSAPVEGPYSFDDLIGDVVGLWDRLGIEQSYFVGLSIGGMTAQGLALHHYRPGQGPPSWPTRRPIGSDDFRAAFDQRVALAEGGGMEAVVESTIERWFTESYRASGGSWLDEVRGMIRTTSVAGYVGCARAIQGLAYLDELDSLDHPVLLIAGTQDPATPPAGMRLMQERIAGSRFVELDTAHLSNIEQAAGIHGRADGVLLEAIGNAGAARDSRPGIVPNFPSPSPPLRGGEGRGEVGDYSAPVWSGASGWKAWKAKAKLMS